MSANQEITSFIADNKGSNVVIQLEQANNNRDRIAFLQLIAEIREVMRLEIEIEQMQRRIQSHIYSIKDISKEIRVKKNLVKNGKNFHRIKRGKSE